MSTKAEAISDLKQEYQAWQKLINQGNAGSHGSNPERTLKDTLVHVMAWQKRSISRMEAAANGTKPIHQLWPPEMETDDDACLVDINAWIQEHFRDWSWEAVYQAWQTGFQHFITLSEAAPESDLLPAGKYPWLDGYALLDVITGSVEHHREHREEFQS
jgi:hypothetical protein